MLYVRRPSIHRLREIYEEQRAMPFPYPGVGATISAPDTATWPAGFHFDHFGADVGADDGDRFERAGRHVLEWVPQKGAGIQIYPDEPVAADRAFVLVIPFPGVGCAVAPARVVYLVDEPDRFGFAYGTLPGHPERGEEAFILARAGGRIRFEVYAFSHPEDPLARLGRPVARAIQVRTINTYLSTLAGAVK